MRLSRTPERAPPHAIEAHLLPHERSVIWVRQHPGMLVPAAAIAAGASLAAIALSTVRDDPAAAKYIVWLLTAFLIVRFLAALKSWATSYIVITNQRFLLVSDKIASSPVADLRVLTIEPPSWLLGKLGYGAFRIGPDGPSQLVVDYIPHLEELELAVIQLLFQDESD